MLTIICSTVCDFRTLVHSSGACCRIQAYAQQKQQRQDEHEAQKAAKKEVADRCMAPPAQPRHACNIYNAL